MIAAERDLHLVELEDVFAGRVGRDGLVAVEGLGEEGRPIVFGDSRKPGDESGAAERRERVPCLEVPRSVLDFDVLYDQTAFRRQRRGIRRA